MKTKQFIILAMLFMVSISVSAGEAVIKNTYTQGLTAEEFNRMQQADKPAAEDEYAVDADGRRSVIVDEVTRRRAERAFQRYTAYSHITASEVISVLNRLIQQNQKDTLDEAAALQIARQVMDKHWLPYVKDLTDCCAIEIFNKGSSVGLIYLPKNLRGASSEKLASALEKSEPDGEFQRPDWFSSVAYSEDRLSFYRANKDKVEARIAARPEFKNLYTNILDKAAAHINKR